MNFHFTALLLICYCFLRNWVQWSRQSSSWVRSIKIAKMWLNFYLIIKAMISSNIKRLKVFFAGLIFSCSNSTHTVKWKMLLDKGLNFYSWHIKRFIRNLKITLGDKSRQKWHFKTGKILIYLLLYLKFVAWKQISANQTGTVPLPALHSVSTHRVMHI